METVMCSKCHHDRHEPGKCQTLYVYARGPTDPPGNQGCLCGLKVTLTAKEHDDWARKLARLGKAFRGQ